MKGRLIRHIGCVLLLGGVLALSTRLQAQDSLRMTTNTSSAQLETYLIDLPTVLRLANARNIDVQIAQQELAQAKAAYDGAVIQFLPWLAPGITFRKHDNLLQDVAGNIIDVNKESYAPGLTLAAQVELGDAIYESLAARQGVRAAGSGVEGQRQNSILTAVQGYFDLSRAQAEVEISREAHKISKVLEQQLVTAASAGLAYKGDELRVKVQTGQSELALSRAMELRRTMAARLAEVLHLDPKVELVAKESELVPLALVATNAALGSLVDQALAKRPEIRESQAARSAASYVKQGAVYGPLIPTIGGQMYVGGLGGGREGAPSRFGQSEDYAAFLSWRVGPGGLFDSSRTKLAKSREETVRLNEEKLRDEITREVVETLTRFRSLADQLVTSQRNLQIAVEAQKLAVQRKEFAVGAVLEDIQTQQDLTRARSEFVGIVAEYNKVQYALQRAIGNALAEGEIPQK